MSKMGDNDATPRGEELEKEPPFPLTEVDKWVLSQTDEEFHLHDWEELRVILGGYGSFICLLFELIRIAANGEAVWSKAGLKFPPSLPRSLSRD